MSGHSHYSTIKRAKEANDAAKGKIFSKHAKNIALAIKAGGGADPELNSKLRFAIDQAKANNMPKANIDRILERAAEVGNLEEVVYEGYGPGGIAVLVLAATDNKNRTAQEVKNLFEKEGGSLASPGSVTYNFDKRGMIIVKKGEDKDSQILKLIDLGAEDIEEEGNDLEVYTSYEKLADIKDILIREGFSVESFEIVMKPKSMLVISMDKTKKAFNLLTSLEDHDDVQSVFTNMDVPQGVES